MSLTVIVLTKNSQRTLGAVLESCADLAERMVVVDSGSTDGTREVAERYRCEWLEHPFEDYGSQRRWAQAEVASDPDQWLLHLDSDEVLSDALKNDIRKTLAAPRHDAYVMRRISHFLGRAIRHGHMQPSYHLRLFRAGAATCEFRRYDQHFITERSVGRLKGVVLDLHLVTIGEWIASHNRWADQEVQEVLSARQAEGVLEGSLTAGDTRARKRWAKEHVYYRCPPFLRAVAFFFYNYLIKRGFLDGRAGLVYHVLHAFWFRFLVDAKLYERRIGWDPDRTGWPQG